MSSIGVMAMPADFRYRDVFLKGKPQHDRFDLFRIRHPSMDVGRRAKIFSPFDALKGFNEAIASKDVLYRERVELSDEDRNAFMADVTRVTRAMQKAFQPEKINYGAYSDKLSHLHFHLAPKYVDGPDYGGIFQMNPGKVYLTDAEYQELIDAVRANL